MKKKHREKEAAKSKNLVARYSLGNVGLQIKRFVTEEEKNARKKRVLAAKFV